MVSFDPVYRSKNSLNTIVLGISAIVKAEKKTNLFKRTIALMLFFVVTLSGVHAQFVVQYPTGAQSMTTCLNPSLLTVRVDVAVATTDNNVVTLTLPPGSPMCPDP